MRQKFERLIKFKLIQNKVSGFLCPTLLTAPLWDIFLYFNITLVMTTLSTLLVLIQEPIAISIAELAFCLLENNFLHKVNSRM